MLKKHSLLAGNLNVRVITPDILSDFLDGKIWASKEGLRRLFLEAQYG